eukprot:Nk52_evm68s217 gene=Nk52_evmTU68s217
MEESDSDGDVSGTEGSISNKRPKTFDHLASHSKAPRLFINIPSFSRNIQQATNTREEEDELEETTSPDDSIQSSIISPLGSSGASALDSGDLHENYCVFCGKVGFLVLCKNCTIASHLDCTYPILKATPEGDWECPLCQNPIPQGSKAETLYDWRVCGFSDSVQSAEALRTDPLIKKRPKQIFVKFVERSHIHCMWVYEVQFTVDLLQGSKLKFYQNKYKLLSDLPIPCFSYLENSEEFAEGGIKREWCEVERVIHSDFKSQPYGSGQLLYLIKWKGLHYDKCTWEPKTMVELSSGLAAIKFHMKLNSSHYYNIERKVEDTPFTLYRRQPEFVVGSGLNLYPYQLDGLNWLRQNWYMGKGAFLADEMGLGKTIQVITFLRSLIEEKRAFGPFLLLAPLSTISNWEMELQKWANNLNVVVYTGNGGAREKIRKYEFEFKATYPKKAIYQKFNVLLTTYEVFLQDQAYLSSMKYNAVVADEGHRLKNHKSKLFQSLDCVQRDMTVMMTGTPLQNNLVELFNLLYVMEKKTFTTYSDFADNFKDIPDDRIGETINHILEGRMLRRFKVDVIKKLPERKDIVIRVGLTPIQKACYEMILTRNYELINSAPKKVQQVNLLNVVMELKKCCNHTLLFPAEQYRFDEQHPIGKGEQAQEERCAELIKMSGKVTILIAMLHTLKKQGHRVLIFSQMTSVLNILEECLAGRKFSFLRLDGSVGGFERQRRISLFNRENSPFFCFLISTKAGGVGLNLASADTVILFDADWNPHNDIQALSRAHRIGQTSKVLVFRLATIGTVEERIMKVAQEKLVLSNAFIDNPARASSKEELRRMCMGSVNSFFGSSYDNSIDFVNFEERHIEQLLDRSDSAMERNVAETKRILGTMTNANLVDEDDAEAVQLLALRHEELQAAEVAKRGVGKRKGRINYSEDQETSSIGPSSSRKTFELQKNTFPVIYNEKGEVDLVCGLNESERLLISRNLFRFGAPSETNFSSFCRGIVKHIPHDNLIAYFAMFFACLCEEQCHHSLPHFVFSHLRNLGPDGVCNHLGNMLLYRNFVEHFLHSSGLSSEDFLAVVCGKMEATNSSQHLVRDAIENFHLGPIDYFDIKKEWESTPGLKFQDVVLIVLSYHWGFENWRRIKKEYEFKIFSNEANVSSKRFLEERLRTLCTAIVLQTQSSWMEKAGKETQVNNGTISALKAIAVLKNAVTNVERLTSQNDVLDPSEYDKLLTELNVCSGSLDIFELENVRSKIAMEYRGDSDIQEELVPEVENWQSYWDRLKS